MDIIFFENILIKFLFSKIEIRDKVIHYIVPEIFEDHKNIQLIKCINSMIERFERFPTIPELKIELQNEDVFKKLLEIIELDVSEFDDKFLLEKLEDFIKSKLIHNLNVDIAMNLSNNKTEELKEFPDKLREAIAFSFDTKIGLDILDEEERLYNHLHNKDRVISTAIEYLNKVIEGGFHEKSLTLFMAETNLGKSLIMCSLAVDTILKNKNVLYITCEMSEEKISERIMSNLFDINSEDLKLLTKNKFHEKFDKIKTQVKNKVIIKEYPPRAINANHIRNLIKELSARKKFSPDIIFIDYLGIMNAIYKNKGDNTYLEVKRISEEVRALAVELGIPIVSAVQTNRGGFGDSEIDLTSISDSIGTAATADVIIGVTQSEEYRKSGRFNWIILKNRYGLNKILFPVKVDYYKMRVYEDEEYKVQGLSTSITKDNPINEKQKKENVDNTINEVKNIINKDFKQKFDKMLGNFDEIE